MGIDRAWREPGLNEPPVPHPKSGHTTPEQPVLASVDPYKAVDVRGWSAAIWGIPLIRLSVIPRLRITCGTAVSTHVPVAESAERATSNSQEAAMRALYQIAYRGGTYPGEGVGALYIGAGQVLGIDVTGARFRGSYVERDGHLIGQFIMTSAGGTLVTGAPFPLGEEVVVSFDLQPGFDSGDIVVIRVGDRSVQVVFDKIGDIA